MLKFINKSDPGMHKGMLRESEGVKGLVARGGELRELDAYGDFVKLRNYTEAKGEFGEMEIEKEIEKENGRESEIESDNGAADDSFLTALAANHNFDESEMFPFPDDCSELLQLDISTVGGGQRSMIVPMLSPTPSSLLKMTTTSPTPARLDDLLMGTQDLKKRLEEMSREVDEEEEEEEEAIIQLELEPVPELERVPAKTNMNTNMNTNTNSISNITPKKLLLVGLLGLLISVVVFALSVKAVFQLGKTCEMQNWGSGKKTFVTEYICPTQVRVEEKMLAVYKVEMEVEVEELDEMLEVEEECLEVEEQVEEAEEEKTVRLLSKIVRKINPFSLYEKNFAASEEKLGNDEGGGGSTGRSTRRKRRKIRGGKGVFTKVVRWFLQ